MKFLKIFLLFLFLYISYLRDCVSNDYCQLFFEFSIELCNSLVCIFLLNNSSFSQLNNKLYI